MCKGAAAWIEPLQMNGAVQSYLYICDHEPWSPTMTALARNWCHLNTFPGKPITQDDYD